MQDCNVFTIVFLIHQTTGFFISEEKLGEITPMNAHIVVNDILELNCTVFEDSGIDVSVMYWEDYTGQRAPADHTLSVGERTLMLRRNITSVKEEGIYTCLKMEANGELVTIGYTHLVIEYEAVREVANFTCVLYKQRDELTCSWEIGLYHNPCYLQFNASLSLNKGSFIPCPTKIGDQCAEMSEISCTWTSDDAVIGAFKNSVYLGIRNTEYDVSKEFLKIYDRQTITKYEPTSFIHVPNQNMTNCTCANITWEGITGILSTLSKLTIQSVWDSRVYTTENISPSLMVCDLIPASEYNVMVQVKHPQGLYYSDKRESRFTTCSTAPSGDPSVFRSGFSSSTCYNTLYRNVTLYWKKIPRKHQNGNLKKYILAYNGATVVVSAERSHGQLQIPCARNSTVSVYGCNEIGCSPNSTITIPQIKDSFAPTKLIAEHLNTSEVELTWFGGEGQIEADIVWCSAKPAPFQCQNEINLLLFKGNVTHTVLHQSDIDDSIQDVMFGVAILDEKNTSSGIKWQDPCVYKKDSEPREIRDVSLQPDSPENSLIVAWSPHLCDTSTDNNAYVHSYKIIYCQLISSSKCKGFESSDSVLASANTQYIIRNLEPDIDYGIWVQALSLTKEGPLGEMVTGRPTNNDLPPGAAAGIVVASILVFVLVLAGTIFIVRNVKEKLGFDEAFPIHIPEMDNKNFIDEQGKSHQYEQVEKNVSVSEDTGSIAITTQSFTNGLPQSNGVLIQMTKMSNPVNETSNHDQIKLAKSSLNTGESASEFIENQRNDKPKQKKELPPDYTKAVTVDQSLKENADISDYIASPELGTINDGYVPLDGKLKDNPNDNEKYNLGTLPLNEQAQNPEQNTEFGMQNQILLNNFNETAACNALHSGISTETNISTRNLLPNFKQNKYGYHSDITTADLVEESNNNGIVMMCSDYVPCNLEQAIEHSDPSELKSNAICTTYTEREATNSSASTIGYVTHSGTKICNM